MLNTKIFIHGFHEGQFNDFLGRMLTQADALGLEKVQSEAYKSIIKQEVWKLWEYPKFMEEKTLVTSETPE